MTAPPWDVRLLLYPGANPAADPGTWPKPQNISAYIRHRGSDGGQPITYTEGRPDEATTVDPGQMTLTLDNTDGRFTAQNPMGAYYPLLDLNTPIVMGTVSGSDNFGNRTSSSGWGTSSSGQTWTTSGTATNWTVGSGVGSRVHPTAGVIAVASLGNGDAADLTGSFVVSMSAVATGAALVTGARVRVVDDSNYYLMTVEFNTDSTITTKIWIVQGTLTQLVALAPVPSLTYSAGTRIKCWFEADGPALRVKVGLEASPEPTTWQLTTTNTTLTGAGVGLQFWRLTGNTNTNPTASFDDFEVTAIEFVGNVAKWPPRWDMSGRNAYAPIAAYGILRRLRKSKGALQTPLEHQLPLYGPKGYWTLQDGSAAASFANVVAGGTPATFSNVTPAADDTLAGGSVAPTMLTAGGVIRGSCKANGGTGFSAMFFVKLSALPGSKTAMATFKTGAGRVTRWTVSVDATTLYVEGVDADGVSVASTSNLHSVVTLTEWMAFQLETTVSGANTNWALDWHQVGATTYYASSGSFASTVVSKVTSFVLGGTDLLGAAFAHVWLGENTLPFVTNSFSLVSSGYSGELASDRITRIAAEAGIPVTIEAGTSEACGPQRTLKAVDEIQAAADADYGILYERSNGLGFRPRSARRNQAVFWSLSVAAGEIAEPPEPIYDDQRTANSWTVSRDNGSYAVVSDPVSIAAVGEYEQSVAINVATDDVLIGQGEMRTYFGSRQVLRWPGLDLDFARNPSLLATWRARSFAPRITVTTGLSQVIGAEPDVIVEGYSCQLTPEEWTATLSCSEASVWDTGTYDDTAWRSVYGPSLATLSGSLTTTATSITVDAGGETWRTGAVTLTIEIDGEWISISNISGSGPYTLTVSARSVNAVVKAHSSGAAITFARQARYTY